MAGRFGKFGKGGGDDGAAARDQVMKDVRGILTQNEEVLAVALQNVTALQIRKDSVIATNNRLIFYRPGMLGRVNFDDVHWQDIEDVTLQSGFVAAEITAKTVADRTESLGGLDKDQAKKLYGVCQQLEQEWREKRRIREMEEARARSGGVYITGQQSAPAAPAEDPVQKLAKAKSMLDQGLISEAEYEAVKAKILSTM